jgi:hypothetical protein
MHKEYRAKAKLATICALEGRGVAGRCAGAHTWESRACIQVGTALPYHALALLGLGLPLLGCVQPAMCC